MDARTRPSLEAVERCAQTGAPMAGQCAGHWDYYGSYMVWTRHFRARPTVRWKLVRYDQVAPERIPTLCP